MKNPTLTSRKSVQTIWQSAALLIACAALFFVQSAKATLTFYEPFSTATYANNTQLGSTTGNFNVGNAAGGGAVLSSNIAQMTYSGLVCSNGSAGAVKIANTTTSNRGLGKSFTGITSGDVYLSFLLNPTVLPTTNRRAVAHFINSTIGVAGVFIDPSGRLQVTKNGNPFATNNLSPTNGLTALTLNTTNLIVYRYSYGAGAGDDTATLWINPSSSSFGAGSPPTATISTNAGSDLTTIDSVNISSYTSSSAGGSAFGSASGQMWIDEIRVGTTWADVTPSDCVSAAITTQPSNQTNFANLSATFSVVTTGSSVTNQWQVSTDGGSTFNNLTGATGTSYTTNSLPTAADQNKFRVIVGAPCSGTTITSSVVTLTVSACTGVSITSGPTDVTTTGGLSATFTNIATGSGVTNQWQISTDNGATFNNLTGATSSTYTTNPIAQAANGNKFRCISGVPCDTSSATSSVATLTVVCGTASVFTQPTPQGTYVGSTATFTVVGAGSGPTYQWQTNNGGGWVDATGAATSSYTTPATVSVDNGLQVRVVVSVSCDSSSVTSSVVTLQVGTATTTAFRSAATGNWNANATWQLSADGGANWFAATTTPTDANSTNILIRSPNTVTVTADLSVDSLTVENGATNVVNSGITFTVANGADAVDMLVNGVLKSAGTNTVNGVLEFTSTGKYQHNWTGAGSQNLGVIPTATWDTGSTCEIIGFTTPTTKTVWSSNALHGLSQSFYNFTWNNPSQTTTVILGGALTNVSGNFDYNGGAVSGNIMSLGDNRAGSNTLVIGGNLTVSGTGKLLFDSHATGLHTNIVRIGGNLTVNAGATIDPFGDNGTTLVFSGADSQFTVTGSQLEAGSWNYEVTPNAKLTMNQAVTVGNGKTLPLSVQKFFVVGTNATLVGKAAITCSQTIAAGAPAGTGIVGTNATFIHDVNSTTVMKATWATGSTCEIRGITTSSPTTTMAQVFNNLTWNCTNQTTSVNFAGASWTNLGNFRLQHAGTTNQLRLGSTTTPTVRIEGNMTIDNGTLVLGSGTGLSTVDVLGNVTVASGAGLMPASSSQAPVFNVTGDVVNNGTLTMRVTAPGVAAKINKTAGTLNYSGDLVITGTGVGGTTYDMFDASAFTGSFSTVTTLGAGSNWFTGNLTTDGTVLLNRAPTPANPSVTRASGLTAKVLMSAVTATDADGHTVTLNSVSGTTTNGATVSNDGTYYTLPANTVNDAFTYVVSDAFGGTNTGTVNITIGAGNGQTTGSINTSGGNPTLTFYGIPGNSYTIQVSTDLSVWTDVNTSTAGGTGVIIYTDTAPPTPAAFYRLHAN